MRTLVIVNPVAGQGRGLKVLSRVENQLTRRGLDVSVYRTRYAGDATEKSQSAVRQGIELVVGVGGDGTITEIANGLAGTATILGVVPAGTVDVFAREMGIPVQLDKACGVIAEGDLARIDLGKAGARYFTLVASAGIDAQLIRDVSPEAKRVLKDLAYPLTGLKTLLTHRPILMKVTIDGKKREDGYFVVIGNAKYYAGRFSITTKATIDDGFLDVCIFKKGDIGSFVKYIQGVVRGRHLRYPDVVYERATSVIVENEGSLVQADGDLIGRTPMRFEIAAGALTVRVPRARQD
ncbi:MAG: diacylglycerol/lipid kinase family protein [Terriglobia bacterium]